MCVIGGRVDGRIEAGYRSASQGILCGARRRGSCSSSKTGQWVEEEIL